MRTANSVSTIAVTATLNVVGTAGFLVLPTVVEGAQLSLHMSDREIGLLSALGMGCSMGSALLAKSWVRRLAWPTAARLALLGMVSTYGLSILFHERLPFFALQGLAGFFCGSLYSLTLTILSDSEQPDRNFGFAIAAQVVFQVAGLLAGPALLRLDGIDSLLAIFALLSALSLPLLRFLPDRGRAVPATVTFRALLRASTTLALFGCFFFLLNAACYWTYITIIAQRAGLEEHQIANSLAVGVSAGLLGALAASWLGTRFHRNWALTLGAVLTVAAAAMLIGPLGVVQFTISAALYNFAWNYSLAYQYAAVNATSSSGHGVALAPAFHTAGAAAGPAIAALAVSPNNFAIVIWLIDFGVLASLACFLAATLAARGAAPLTTKRLAQ